MASHLSDGMQDVNPITVALRSEIAQELVEVASTVANAQIDGFTTRLSDALLRASAACIDPKEAKCCFAAAGLLKKNRYPFYYVVSARLAALLRYEMQGAEYPSVQQDDINDVPPSLPADVEIDKKLSLIKASRAIADEHADRLTMVGMRLAGLFDRPELASAQSPFRPHIFLSAIHDAWCEFQPDVDAHHLVFPLLGPELCLDMGPILHAVNTALIKRGIAPHTAAAERGADGADDYVEEADDALLQQLRQLLSEPETKNADRPLADGFPSLFDDDALQAEATRNALLGYLTRLPQEQPLADIRRDAPQDSVSPTDASVIELVAGIFGTVERDTNIADELKTWIASLQLAMLKAALNDRNFFFKRSHPPRRVFELLLRLSAGWDSHRGKTDPLYLLLTRSVERIRQQAGHHAGVFAEVMLDLDAFIRREDTASAQALARPIAQALQQEKPLLARKTAQQEVALRIGTGEVAAFVEAFLEDKWVSVLTLAYGVKDDKPQAAEHALKTMDELVWSVKPKITTEERKELLAKLPSIVAALNKWLDLIKWNDTARARFFDELAKCHASIVRAPLELSPERQVQLAIAAAKQAAERRLQWQAKTAPDEFTQAVRKLERGTWLNFAQQGDSVTKLRLAWVSPSRSLFIFATLERKEALTLTDDELAQMLREQRAHIVPGAGLVRRALLDALSANSAGIGGEAAA